MLGLQFDQPLFLDRVTPAALIFMRRGDNAIDLPAPRTLYRDAEPCGQPGDLAIDCGIGTLIGRGMPPPPEVTA
ncbi:MAG: hypothetical protein ACI9U2_005040 [Bradymonadia bacterium]|jgi:hypothetical protein